MIKHVKLAEFLNYCDCFLECTIFKDDLIECKCLCSNKNSQQMFDEKLKKQFFNTYKISKHDNSKFILLLQKSMYPYEWIYGWLGKIQWNTII